MAQNAFFLQTEDQNYTTRTNGVATEVTRVMLNDKDVSIVLDKDVTAWCHRPCMKAADAEHKWLGKVARALQYRTVVHTLYQGTNFLMQFAYSPLHQAEWHSCQTVHDKWQKSEKQQLLCKSWFDFENHCLLRSDTKQRDIAGKLESYMNNYLIVFLFRTRQKFL